MRGGEAHLIPINNKNCPCESTKNVLDENQVSIRSPSTKDNSPYKVLFPRKHLPRGDKVAEAGPFLRQNERFQCNIILQQCSEELHSTCCALFHLPAPRASEIYLPTHSVVLVLLPPTRWRGQSTNTRDKFQIHQRFCFQGSNPIKNNLSGLHPNLWYKHAQNKWPNQDHFTLVLNSRFMRKKYLIKYVQV